MVLRLVDSASRQCQQGPRVSLFFFFFLFLLSSVCSWQANSPKLEGWEMALQSQTCANMKTSSRM